MDFFSIQDSRRKQSAILIVFFVVAMLSMALVVHVVAIIASMAFSSGASSFTSLTLASKIFIGLIGFICFIGCFFTFMDVRAGGPTLAQYFGAEEANRSSYNHLEKDYFDIANEMAIASNCDTPELFVLRHEKSINAFVVGGFSGKEALVVSKGALDKLDRQQLKAVVAHEFAHIVNGDLRLNMRLLIVLSGLHAIDDVGKMLINTRHSRSNLHPGYLVGTVVRCIGSVGTFFGRALRAAISRQREFMADASAVQYTRMPSDLAFALNLIREEHDNVGIHSSHAEKLAHLCFHVGDVSDWKQKLFATHPSIQERIDAIEPNFATKLRAKKRSEDDQKISLHKVGHGTQFMPLSQEVDELVDVSDHSAIVLADAASCVALLHAVFVSEQPSKSKLYYQAISFAYNKQFAQKVNDIQTSLAAEISSNKMALVETATKKVRETVQVEYRQRLLQSLEKLLRVEGEYTLMNYATLQLIRRKLDAEFPVLDQAVDSESDIVSGSSAKTFDSMGSDFAVLLSLIVNTSGNGDASHDEQFQIALSCYTKDQYERRTADEPGIVEELEDAFQTLYVQPRAIREAFVRHCIEIAQADGHIAISERAMLDLFAASLKCDDLIAA